MTITDDEGNVIYFRRRYLPKNIEVIGRNIEKTNKLLFTENYIVKTDNNVDRGAVSNAYTKIIYDIAVDEFVDPFIYDRPPNTSIGLRVEGHGSIRVKEIDDAYVMMHGKLIGNSVLDGQIRQLRDALLVAPYLSFYNPLVESTSLFYLVAGRSKIIDDFFDSGGEPSKYMSYAEILKNVLFAFDLDRMIESGNYKDEDIAVLKELRDGTIVTNLNTVIMWTAIQTRDVEYIDKTYAELKEYADRKPKYLKYYLDVFENIREPLPFDRVSTDNVIRSMRTGRD